MKTMTEALKKQEHKLAYFQLKHEENLEPTFSHSNFTDFLKPNLQNFKIHFHTVNADFQSKSERFHYICTHSNKIDY